MRAIGYGLTDTGRKRQQNEDFLLVDQELGLFIVCDGVGGHAAGEIASRTTAETIQAYLKENRQIIDDYTRDPSFTKQALVTKLIEKSVQVACAKVYQMGRKDLSKFGMGTTLVMLITAGDYAVLAHVGDSRIYLVRAGQSHQLTEDHSIVNDQIKRGVITPKEAVNSPFSHVITRAVGYEEVVQVDTLHMEVAPGDTFLLCSDGLSDYFQGTEITDCLKQTKIDQVPKQLVNFANQKGGKDNITALAVRIEGEARTDLAIELMKKIEIVYQIPLFHHLAYKELAKVLNIVNLRTYQAGSHVITEDSLGEEMFIILSGSVKVTKKGQQLAVLRQGSFFGELQLLDNVPRSATVTASEPLKVLTLSRKDLFPLLRREQGIAVKLFWEFCQVMDSRLRSLNDLFVGISSEHVPKPIMLPFFEEKAD